MKRPKNLADCFENGWLKQEFLWPLRQEIILGSLYFADYRNSFGIDERKVCDFFTSFWDSYCGELAKRDNLMEEAHKRYEASDKKVCEEDIFHQLSLDRYDNEETLLDWANSFVNDGSEYSPLPPKLINVDIHWDFARSIQVIAADESEAYDLVYEMMKNGQIPFESFEAMDWELDTTYQPE